MSLSKADKKVVRELLETGVLREFKTGLQAVAAIIHEWEETGGDNRVYYHKIYKQVTNFDKHIAWRYDGVTGAHYLSVVAAQLSDGVITIEDIAGFTPEVRDRVISMSGI